MPELRKIFSLEVVITFFGEIFDKFSDFLVKSRSRSFNQVSVLEVMMSTTSLENRKLPVVLLVESQLYARFPLCEIAVVNTWPCSGVNARPRFSHRDFCPRQGLPETIPRGIFKV